MNTEFKHRRAWECYDERDPWPADLPASRANLSAWCIRVFVIVSGIGICAYVVWFQ
jgi:hypothetical protein